RTQIRHSSLYCSLTCHYGGNGFSIFLGFSSRKQLRKTKIEDFQPSLWCEHDVFRLQISMDNSSFMRRSESIGQLSSKIQDSFDRNRTFRQLLAQRFARY